MFDVKTQPVSAEVEDWLLEHWSISETWCYVSIPSSWRQERAYPSIGLWCPFGCRTGHGRLAGSGAGWQRVY